VCQSLDISIVQFVVGSLLTFLGILVTAIFSIHKLGIERKKLDLAKRELIFQSDALDFSAFLQDWQNTSDELVAIISETEIDRIIILRAWNGAMHPLWTTAVYQLREEGQEPRQYVHFELDTDYVQRLREITGTGQSYFVTDDIQPQSRIYQVYSAEGVKASYWAHIETIKLSGSDAQAIAYMSFSTHIANEISEKTRTRCMIMAGRLKGIAANFRVEQAA
jgi:hypothetical protein